MKPELRLQEESIRMSLKGKESPLPDIVGGLNIQNKTRFELDESDEIYEGYGRLMSGYPYRKYISYDRKLTETGIQTAVLENDFIEAVFLPSLGGRLWRLTDKRTGSNLLYTNDVIRPSNLAVRNAWFSGGVEWNVGVIGHTPFTMEPLFTARLLDEDGNPVLRMYEYERIRKVVYQMDFWTEENSAFLNCRMRIVNDSPDVVPMYWWSNMAVPEYEDGRILVPADEAFTSDAQRVYKVKLPLVDGVDVTQYTKIPDQVDYFFHIPQEQRKYIANLNSSGYGLLQISTQRLQGRKLFTWGHNDGSARWQEFLTDRAGSYIEIQAGLGKTQYGCIPMAPHTAWEWVEQYGPVSAAPVLCTLPFAQAREEMNALVHRTFAVWRPGEKLASHRKTALTRGDVFLRGGGYGELENLCREKRGEKPLCGHLDFGSDDARQEEWKTLLQTGKLPAPDPSAMPSDFMTGGPWFELLKKAARAEEGNWYVHYHLGLLYLTRRQTEDAAKEFLASERLCENPWAEHGLAVCCMSTEENEKSVEWMCRGLNKKMEELSYVKEGLRILLMQKAYEEVLSVWDRLPALLRREDRIRCCRLLALAQTGGSQEVYEELIKDDFELADVREGDHSLDALWKQVCEDLFPGEERTIPHQINFSSIRRTPQR